MRAKIALAPSVVVGQELEERQIDIVIIAEDVIHVHLIGDSGRNLGLEIRPKSLRTVDIPLGFRGDPRAKLLGHVGLEVADCGWEFGLEADPVWPDPRFDPA